jgi:predicted short-subunit dehydrogenase-like oxidoreductase (DUF2520 family)
VGTTLAVLLRRRGHAITSVISRRQIHASRCARLVRCGNYSTRLSEISPDTNLLIIATPDESIRSVSGAVSRLRHLDFQHLTALHTSGVLTSDELRALRAKGATTLSFHPLQTFPEGILLGTQINAMQGISYGIEGPPRALGFGRGLAAQLGGRTIVIPKREKILYHVAGVIASNYIVALLGAVEELLNPIAGSAGLRHLRVLVETSVRNAFRMSPREALTGPIVRGSSEVVARHLRALRGNHDLRALYQAVGLYALELSRGNRRLTKSQERRLRRILSKAG